MFVFGAAIVSVPVPLTSPVIDTLLMLSPSMQLVQLLLNQGLL